MGFEESSSGGRRRELCDRVTQDQVSSSLRLRYHVKPIACCETIAHGVYLFLVSLKSARKRYIVSAGLIGMACLSACW